MAPTIAPAMIAIAIKIVRFGDLRETADGTITVAECEGRSSLIE